MLKDKSYIVLGVGTDIGKTYLVENLCQKNSKYYAIKPVITGFNNDGQSDTERILNALKIKINISNLDKISPYRFKKPISPNFLGNISKDHIIKFCLDNIDNCQKNQKTLLIESAGGVMTPINNDFTFLDLAQSLKLPILLVTSNYLGAISHTLCCLEAIKNKNLKISKIIINEHQVMPIKTSKLIDCLNNFCNYEIISMKNFIKNS
jgi:dethiobiotin synthetase